MAELQGSILLYLFLQPDAPGEGCGLYVFVSEAPLHLTQATPMQQFIFAEYRFMVVGATSGVVVIPVQQPCHALVPAVVEIPRDIENSSPLPLTIFFTVVGHGCCSSCACLIDALRQRPDLQHRCYPTALSYSWYIRHFAILSGPRLGASDGNIWSVRCGLFRSSV